MKRALVLAASCLLPIVFTTAARSQAVLESPMKLQERIRALKQRGEHEQALAICELGLHDAEARRDRRLIAMFLYLRGGVQAARSDLDRARDDLLRAAALEEQLGNVAQAANVHLWLGRVEERRGEVRLARFHRLTACTAYVLCGRHGEAATQLIEVGRLQALCGEPREGIQSLVLARFVQRELGDRQGAAASLNMLGVALSHLGRTAEGLDYVDRSILESANGAERSDNWALHANRGQLYERLGRYDEACRELELVLAAQRAQHLHVEGVLTRILLGELQSLACHHDDAKRTLLAAREAAEGLGDIRLQRVVQRMLLQSAIWAGRMDEARTLAEASLVEGRGSASPLEVAEYEGLVGEVLERCGEYRRALELLTRARDTKELFGRRPAAAMLTVRIANTLFMLGEFDRSAEEARSAMRGFATMAAGLGEKDALVARRDVADAAGILLDSLSNIEQRIEQSSHGRHDALMTDAFWSIEQSRAALLTETLLNRETLLATRVPAELLAAEASAGSSLRRAMQQGLTASTAGADPRARLDAAHAGYVAARSRVERALRGVGRLLSAPEPSLATTRAQLPEDTALVLYARTGAGWFALVASRAQARLHLLAHPSASIDTKLDAWRRLLAEPSTDARDLASADEKRLATELYELLVRPFERTLRGKTRLLVSPDAALTCAPLEALLRRDAGGKLERLVERFEVCYVPSAAIATVLRAECAPAGSGCGLVALGDPCHPDAGAAGTQALAPRRIEGLRPLPESRTEVVQVRALFDPAACTTLLGADASVAGLTRALAMPGQRRAIHLACHARIDPVRPSLSCLVLSDGEVLTLAAIERMSFSADLVVLSACATAQGKHAEGEGVLGFVRGIFLAGAPRVLATTWPVQDREARELAVAFYEQWLRAGLTPSAALRAAKRAQLARGVPPQAWAGFVLWGLPD